MWPADSVYILVFSSAVIGGFGHCTGMCGPLVAALSLGVARSDHHRWLPQVLLNLGRVTTYSVLGGIMGLIGSFAQVIDPLLGFQHLVMAVLGSLTALLGIGALRLSTATGFGAPGRLWSGLARKLTSAAQRIIEHAAQSPGHGVLFPLGMALGFIPCGLSYTAYVAATAAGADAPNGAEGFLRGALLLLLFGAGTSPALLLIGRIAGFIPVRVRLHAHRLAALCMIVVGTLFIYRALR
jgi:hypothetical protein